MATLLASRTAQSEEIVQEFFDVITPVELQLSGQASATIKRDGITITTLTNLNRTYKLFTIGAYEILLSGKCLAGEVWSYAIAVSGGGSGGEVGDDSEFAILCDNTTVEGDELSEPFLRRYAVNELGTVSVVDTGLDGVTPFTVSGDVTVCSDAVEAGSNDSEFIVLFDDTTGDQTAVVQFLRQYIVDQNGVVNYSDTTLDGSTGYAVLGSVSATPPQEAIATVSDDSEFIILSDDTLNDQTVVVEFLRQYVVDQAGVVTYVDTTLDGATSYTTIGTVGVHPLPDAETSSATATPNFINSSTAGVTTAGLQKFSVSNVGEAAGVLIGDPLPVGASVTFEGYYDEATDTYVRLNSAAYDATGTTFLIAETA